MHAMIWTHMDHMGWAGGWFMSLFWIAIFVLILAGIWALLRREKDPRPKGGPSDANAEEILKRRFARGEIDEDTFRRIRDELRS